MAKRFAKQFIKMKKGVLLHSDISAVISRLGHTDPIAISDAGLPIPSLWLPLVPNPLRKLVLAFFIKN
ncbi:hypothetical protein AFK69_04310 [Xenorhabdus sp. GDc328]|nr:hypothetical protein AAY47_14620 [Xenorhabdus griffiniae]KOP34470.1 hypothetical protein AFK69_04310 [Xenorhabdus sp. GDc328]